VLGSSGLRELTGDDGLSLFEGLTGRESQTLVEGDLGRAHDFGPECVDGPLVEA